MTARSTFSSGAPGDRGAGHGRERSRTTFAPGALTALLADLARAPAPTGWDLPASPGETVGRFEIVRELGRGGFGVVYEARDTELGRSVAFKAIRSAGSGEARDLRALAEAEAAARLAHPNIVHLYDVGRCERGPFLIMELLRGETLDDRIARGPLPAREAVRIATEIARGVAHAHAQGVVHRDLKPGNVFLCDDGQVKVLDFGLAHVFGKGGIAGGTPAYMAPEQAAGESGDERADVYALGVVVHELVTGSRPSFGAAPGSASSANGRPLPGAPAALSRLVLRMLARDPAERPASAVEVHVRLAAIQRSLEQRPLLWAAWAIAAVALVAALAFAMRSRPLPPGRLLAAVADLDNQTGEADLGGTGELLRVGLDQSRRISMIARSRLVNALREGGAPIPDSIDEGRARAAARSAGAQVLFVPALARTGSGYDLTVRAVDLARGETLFTTREPAVSSRLFAPAIDRLVSRIRRSLKEEPEDARRPAIPVEDVAPANPEALPHYAEGKRLESEARFHEAFEAYREAAAADASFLLPLVEILRYTVQHLGGAQYREIADVEAQRKALRDGLHRLPEKERAYAETLVLPWGEERNMTEAIAALDRSIEGWPEDPRPYVDAANILLLQRADLEAAGPYVEKALALAPLDEGGVIDFLLAAGRLDEALVRATRWVEASPSWLSLNNLHLVHQHRGEVEEDLEVSRRMMQLDPDGFRFPFYAFIAAGAVDEAEAIRRRLRRTDPSWLAIRGRVRDALAAWDVWYRPAPGQPGADIDHTFFRSFIVLPREDPQATWREAEKLFRVGYGFFQCHALQLALLGDRERAFRLAISKAPDGHVCHRLHMAVRAWKGGDREGALSAFSRIWAHSSHLYRGEILAEMGRHREAVDEFRTYRRRRGVSIWDNNFDKRNYPRSLYLEAVSLDALGARAEARNVLALLLKLWERADADLPLLRDAKALERRLFARGR